MDACFAGRPFRLAPLSKSSDVILIRVTARERATAHEKDDGHSLSKGVALLLQNNFIAL
jgi:hypothetical protein